LSETEENPEAEKLKLNWKMVMLVAIPMAIVLIAFVSLVVYATSVKVQIWGMTHVYDEGGWWIFGEPEFSVTIKLAIGNPSAFTVTVRDMAARLTINGIDMGSSGFQDEWYMIPRFDWRVFTMTFSVSGDEADTLESTLAYSVHVSLRGEASCMFYKTLFETTHRKSYS